MSSSAFLLTKSQRMDCLGQDVSRRQTRISLNKNSLCLAFDVCTKNRRSDTTSLSYRNTDDDDDYIADDVRIGEYAMDSKSRSGPVSETTTNIDAIDLPKSFMRKLDTSQEDMLSLENSIGRLAMVCTVLLFTAEFTKNLSISDQVYTLLRTFVN